MFVIRKEQMEVFSKQMVTNFIERMEKHLREIYPDKTNVMNNKQLHQMIQDGIAKAAKYEIKIEGDVRQYLECMIIYGSDFDMSSNCKWASEILENKTISGTMKVRRLVKYSKQVNEI